MLLVHLRLEWCTYGIDYYMLVCLLIRGKGRMIINKVGVEYS